MPQVLTDPSPGAVRSPQCIFAALLLFLCFAASPLASQRGAITLPQNLVELVDESAVIVRGHVISALVEPHPELQDLHTVIVTLRVARSACPASTMIWILRPPIRASSSGCPARLAGRRRFSCTCWTSAAMPART